MKCHCFFAIACQSEFVSKILSILIPLKMFFEEPTMTNDLCKLKDLDDESLIQALKSRYNSSQIYTNCGLLLISINPYKDIGDCNSKLASQYRKKAKHLEPHVYSIVESCLQEEPVYGESTIIIGGESGSGKTECARTILRYLEIGAMGNLDLILESFGNCKTKYNDNSSRFGKLIRINDGKASVDVFLLEKTRVTGYKGDERNFHIFYYVLASKNISLTNDFINFDLKLGVRDLNDEKSMKGSFTDEAIESTSTQDKSIDLTFSNIESMIETYQEIRKSFEIIGVDLSFIENILLGILYIGSIEVTNNTIVKNSYFQKALELLMLDEADIENFLLRKILKVNGEEIKKPYSQNESLVMRNSLARQIYMQLFNYIVIRINRHLSGTNIEAKNLNILDIFGFENFEQNGLDQFCINWCNEKLHDLYIRETFESQKRVLISEDICDKSIIDEIRDKCNMKPSSLGVIEKSVGLADLVLEESFINGNSKNLGQKIKNVLNLKITPSNKLVFDHFNGVVEYDLDDFLVKNKEKCILSPHILMKLDKEIGKRFLAVQQENEKPEKSNLSFDSRDFSSQSETFASKISDNIKNERPFKQNTKSDAIEPLTLRNGDNVIGYFKENLDYLFGIIKKTRIKYIKCIKPNNMKLPMMFDESIIHMQLKSSGILDSICLSKFLYPFSFGMEEFLEKYPFHDLNGSDLIVRGKTKVFLNNDALNELESKRICLLTEVMDTIKLFVKLLRKKLRSREEKRRAAKKHLTIFRSKFIAKIRTANKTRRKKILENDKICSIPSTGNRNPDHSEDSSFEEKLKNGILGSKLENTDQGLERSFTFNSNLHSVKLPADSMESEEENARKNPPDTKTDVKDNDTAENSASNTAGGEDKKSKIKSEVDNKLDKKAIFNKIAKMKSNIDKYIKKTTYETPTKEIEDRIKNLSFKAESGMLMQKHKIEPSKAEPEEAAHATNESYKLKKLKKNRRSCFCLINRLRNEMIADISRVDKFNRDSRRGDEKEAELVKIENQMLKEIINNLKDELDLVKSSTTSKNANNEIFLERLNDDTGSSTHSKMIDSEFSKIRQRYKSFTGDARKTSVCNVFGFLMHAYIESSPLYSNTAYSKNEILSLAHTIYDILFLIDQNALEANFKICLDEIDKRLLDFQENISKVTFVLSNLIELRSLFQKKYNEMKLQEKLQDKNAILQQVDDEQKSKNFKSYEYILLELEISINNLFEQICTLQKECVSDLLPFSVLEHQKIQDFKTKPKFKLFAPPTISGLVEHLEYFYDLSLYFYLPSTFVLSSTSYILSYVDQICFNSLLVRKKFLTFEKCYQIKYNLAELEKFCFNIGFRDGFLNLLNISEAIKVSCAIARIDAGMCDRVDTEEAPSEEQNLNEILSITFLNAPQVNSLCLLFEKALLKKLPNDKSLKKFIDEPRVVFPKLNKLEPAAQLENPSYLPSKCISNIYKCIE